MRTCTKCKQVLDESRFSQSKNKYGKLKFNPWCHSCRTEYNRNKYFGGRKAKKAIKTETHKECMHCHVMTLREDMSGSYCKPCYKARYYDKEKGRKYTAEYRKRNPERWRSIHRIHQFNRKSLIKATDDGTVTDEFLKELLSTKDCYWCKEEILEDQRTVEHLIELSSGGLHSASNLVMACFSCNSSRLNKGKKSA